MLWLDRPTGCRPGGRPGPRQRLEPAEDRGLQAAAARRSGTPQRPLVRGSAVRLVGPQRRRPGAAGGSDVPEGVVRRLDGDARPVGRGFARSTAARCATCRSDSPPQARRSTIWPRPRRWSKCAQAAHLVRRRPGPGRSQRLDDPDRGAQAVRPAIAGRRLSRPAAMVVPGPLARAARLARIAPARSAGRADRHHAAAWAGSSRRGAAMPGRCGPSTATRATSTSSRPTACSWPSCSTTSAAAAPGPCPLPSAACG